MVLPAGFAVPDIARPGRPGIPGRLEHQDQVVYVALSVRTGVCGDRRGRLAWAEVAWTGEGAVEAGWFPAGYEAAIGAEQAALAERFAGVPIWFGRSTLQWWALPSRAAAGRLLTAPSAQELADLLDRLQTARRGTDRMATDNTGAARASDRVSAPIAPVPPRIHRIVPHVSRLAARPC